MEEQPRVLIIDDEEAARYGIWRALSTEGYQLEQAADAAAALAAIPTFQPDVIVSDINMPGMDGVALVERLSQEPDPPLAIMITAFGSEDWAIRALRAGAYNYVHKPYDINELRRVVAHAVEKR